MSVPVGNRKEASMEFLKNARDIEEIFIDLRIHKPKRYTFFFDKLLDYSMELLNKVKSANSIYPENKVEVELRQMYFKEGIAQCQVLVSQVEILYHKLKDDGMPIGLVQQLAEKLDYEIKLIKGAISADKKRYAYIIKKDVEVTDSNSDNVSV